MTICRFSLCCILGDFLPLFRFLQVVLSNVYSCSVLKCVARSFWLTFLFPVVFKNSLQPGIPMRCMQTFRRMHKRGWAEGDPSSDLPLPCLLEPETAHLHLLSQQLFPSRKKKDTSVDFTLEINLSGHRRDKWNYWLGEIF